MVSSEREKKIVGMSSAVTAKSQITALLFDVLAVSAVSITLVFSISIGSGTSSPVAMIVVFASVFASLHVGRALVSIGNRALPTSARIPSEIVAGVSVLSVIMMLYCLVTRYSANAAFLFALAIAIGSVVFNAKRSSRLEPDAASVLISIVGVCALSVVWSWQAIQSFPRLRTSEIFPAWGDFFFHSGVISEFAHFQNFGGTWIFAHGTPIPVYHYANYLLPAAISAFSGLPALALATSFTEPFSFVVMGLGGWVLGVVLGGRATGILCIVTLLLLPNAANYGFKNPYYDFHWLLQISDIGYAIGIAFIAIAYGILGRRNQSLALFGLSVLFTFLTAAFKIQIFVLLVGSGLVLVAIFWQPTKAWLRWAYLGAIVVIAPLLAFLAELYPRAPHFLSTHHQPNLFLAVFLPAGSTGLPNATRLPIELLLLLLTSTGTLLPLYLLGMLWCRRRKLSDLADTVPLIVIGVYCCVAVTFPGDLGDEFQHRPFTLVYAILAIWCASFAARILRASHPGTMRVIVLLAVFALLPLPFFMQRSTQSGQAAWMRTASRQDVPKALFESAAYLHDHALATDITLKSSDDGEAPFLGKLTALSERASYILRLQDHSAWVLWGTPPDVVDAREREANELLRAQTFESFLHRAKSIGINWYVLSPPDHLPAAITDHAVRIARGWYIIHIASE